MTQSITADSSSEKKRGSPPENRPLRVYNALSFIFLLSVLSLITFIVLPHLVSTLVKPESSLEDDVPSGPLPPSHPDSPYNPIDPIDPGLDSYDDESKGEGGFDAPPPYKIGDVKRLRPRLAHPEDSDVDDLPFSRGMNPGREKRQTVLYRLSPFLHPLHYDVNLDVTVRGHNGARLSSLAGHSSIRFRIDGPASNLLEVHAEKLSIVFISLTSSRGDGMNPISTHYNEVKRTRVWLVERPMEEGEVYEMRLNWTTAVVTKGFLGSYETWYTLRNGSRVYQLATQGEPMGTRKWMPAFDEPAMKAKLSLTINHPSGLNARSNAPVKVSKESAVKGIRTTVFSPTTRISPYLYAWSLTDYPELSKEVNGVKVTVVADMNEKMMESSLSHAIFSVQSYFSALSINSSHVFEKMDFVFVPDHISAMENVGHVTAGDYSRDSHIKHRYMYVHELMHQYFGNLITLSWWDEVWINEGLTTMYEIDAVHGEIGTRGSINELRKRRDQHIQLDSFRKTAPLKNEATTELEAWANFDKSYSKGSVILFMMRHLIGEKPWKEGVETFLNKFAFKAVTGDAFLKTIREVARRFHTDETPDFTFHMAKDFFEMRGFPLLKIKRDGRKIKFRQVRFVRGFLDGPNKDNIERSRHYWRIPVYLVKLDGTPYKTILMSSRELAFEVDTDDELILDPTKIVYYRVVYGAETYNKLAQAGLQWADVSPIIHDLVHSAFSGYADIQLAFDVLYRDFKLKHDRQITTWMYRLLRQMFYFDTERRLRVYGLLSRGKSSTDYPENDARNDNPIPYLCGDIYILEDALREYTNNRENLAMVFCREIKKSKGEEEYRELLESFINGDDQIFHPQDVKDYIALLKIHYPNATADLMVKISKDFKDAFEAADQSQLEHKFAGFLHDFQDGFDVGNTEQLHRIFENLPRAARQNRDFITRIFNMKHAAMTENRELGDKIEMELKKHLERKEDYRGKFTKSRVFPLGKPLDSLDLKPESPRSREPQYY